MPAVKGRPAAAAQRQKPALAIACAATALVAACGQVPAHGNPGSGGRVAPPPGVLTAAQACRLVVGQEPRGFFTHVEQVHLVLTTYAKGEPAESQGDISSGMPPRTPVWVVEVHAKAINWDHSAPARAAAPSVPSSGVPSAQPDTDFSVVMNARTGRVSDIGECTCWPLPLSSVGTVIGLPADC